MLPLGQRTTVPFVRTFVRKGTGEMHIGPDPPKTGLKHSLPMLLDRGLGTRTEAVCNCTKVHLGKVPSVADLSKDIRGHRSFRLNDLTVSGQFVGYHIEPARNVARSKANFSEIAPRQESPQESTEGS